MRKQKRKTAIKAILLSHALVFIFALTACGGKQSYTRPSDLESYAVSSIKNSEKDKIIKIDENSTSKLNSVGKLTEQPKTGTKVEFDISADTSGDVYDPNAVDMYGEFVSPSGKLYTTPAFYTHDWARSMEELEVPKLGDEIQSTWLPVQNTDATATNLVINDFLPENRLTTASEITFNSGSNGGPGEQFYGAYTTGGGSEATMQPSAKLTFKYKTEELTKIKIGFARVLGGWEITDWWLQEIKLENDGKWNTATADFSDFIGGLDKSNADTALDANGNTPRQIWRCAYACFFRADGDVAAEGKLQLRDMDILNDGMNSVTANNFKNTTFTDFMLNDATAVGTELMTDLETESFRLRFNPKEAGDWTYRVSLKQNGKTVSQYTSTFTAEANETKGFVRVDKDTNRNFKFDNGEAYVPVGLNQDWYTNPSIFYSYEYDNLFQNFQKYGMNSTRIFMTASWCFGKFRYTNCYDPKGGQMMLDFSGGMKELSQLDYVMDAAEKYGVYIDMTIFNFTELMLTNEWPLSPFNEKNGGYLSKPEDWLTSKRAIQDAKKIVRYLVARLGYSENVLCWELFNEIQWMSNYNPYDSAAWHKEMATYLKSLDPNHMVTTSSAHGDEGELVFEYMDFAAIHQYKSENLGRIMIDDSKRIYEQFNIPVYYTEMGADTGSDFSNYNVDPKGIVIHQANWSGVMGFGAGGGMSWWWDSFTSLGFYSYKDFYTPITNFIALMPKNFTKMKSIYSSDFAFDSATKLYCDSVGYKSGDKAYVYLLDNRFNHIKDETLTKVWENSTYQLKSMENGAYTVRFYDTFKGTVTGTVTVTVTDGNLNIGLPIWTADLAMLIEKN